MKRIGVGLIGYGLGGRCFHAPYVTICEEMDLRAIVSSDAAKVHRDLPAVKVVPDVGALLAEPDIDLVIVSSPDHLHAQHALSALHAGKHVLVDKPFATRIADAEQMIKVAEERQQLLTVFHNRRWDADFLTLRHVLDEGRLGRIVQFESHFDRWRPEPVTTWKDAREFGSWLDLGPHLVDQAIVLFGCPDAIMLDLASLRDGAAAPDYFHAVLHYPDRRVLLHSNKLVAANGLRFAVHGTAGSWIKHGVDPQEAACLAGQVPGSDEWGHDPAPGTLTMGGGELRSEMVPNRPGDYRQFWNGLAAAIRGDGPNPVPAREALLVMEVLEAGIKSASERREVHLAQTVDR